MSEKCFEIEQGNDLSGNLWAQVEENGLIFVRLISKVSHN